MSTPLLQIGPDALALEPLITAVAEGDRARQGRDGAVTTFLGLVRNHHVGRRVLYLDYEAYEPLALKSFERIAVEIESRWPGVRMALHHRTGPLEVGEASVALEAGPPSPDMPHTPVPATVEIMPADVILRTVEFPQSATNTLPEPSTAKPAGNQSCALPPAAPSPE